MSVVNEVYEGSFYTIDRIRNHEVDVNFIYEQPKRVLYLKN